MSQFSSRSASWVLSSLVALAALLPVHEATAQAAPMPSVVAPQAKVVRVATGYLHSEGPVWVPGKGLIFSDVSGQKMYVANGDRVQVYRDPSGYANGNAIDKAGNMYTAQHDRRVTRTDNKGNVTTLVDKYQGKRLNSPNDIIVKSDGTLYFTDPPFGLMGFGPAKGESETGFAGVYRLTKDGKLSVLDRDLVYPNGVAFSPNERVLYVNDTKDGWIYAWDVGADGTIANKRRFADLKAAGKDPFADGLKVDLQGNVYAANVDGVWVFDESGKRIGIISVPEVVANLAFGGADGKTLYITAETSLYSVRTLIAGIGAR